jgi:5-methylcytosine-specific restriction protein A
VSLQGEIEAVARGISTARDQPFAAHPLAQRIRDSWQDEARSLLANDSYRIKGSPGNGQWADSVWLGVFDPIVTESAQHGFYIVYLVSRNGEKVFLSLNQGTTEIYNEVGGRSYLGVLESTAQRDVGLLESKDLEGLIAGPIDLGAETDLSRGYESGNILAIPYERGSVPSDGDLKVDLLRLVALYQALIESRDQVDDDDENDGPASSPTDSELEARRFRWHRRAERSRSLAKAAKSFHGTVCQVEACKKDLSVIYGDLAKGYIEAHHLTPFSSLKGRPTELNPQTDFAVVCPDCHRMLHRRHPDPYSLTELSAILKAAAK